LNLYSSNDCDAVCVTNMDALNPALSRASVAIMPTSTSAGADACIVAGIDNIDQLKNHKVYGLKGTVSEYCFVRNLELAGKSEGDYQFENMDPAAAAVAMQNKNPEQKAIMVWNPFVLQTLKSRSDAKVLFDSSTIPGEIVDMVVVAEASLQKPGGKEFALAIIDTFYEFGKILADPKEGDKALVALGEKFSSLDLDEMKKAVEQTRFYKTPEEALGLLAGEEFPKTMEQVVKFCVEHQIVREQPKVGFGAADKAPGVHLRMDPSYLQEYQAKK
jgi:NitT/TauT family transport system substrate-binding protein